jgi:membrane protease YdiL (CAAX protease family)
MGQDAQEVSPVKGALSSIGKAVLFFVIWAVLISVTSLVFINLDSAPAVWRFLAEAIPLACTLLLTVAFVFLVERRRVRVNITDRFIRDSILGVVIGVLWLAAIVGILILTNTMRIEMNAVPKQLWLWCVALFLNTVMQEFLVRGYMFTAISERINPTVAVVFTTAVFIFLHGGAFEVGVIAVLNVILASLFFSLLLLRSQGLLMPIMAHFAWNLLGGIGIGGIQLSEDYPHILVTQFSSMPLLSGGAAEIEGSLVTAVVTAALCLLLIVRHLRNSATINSATPDGK